MAISEHRLCPHCHSNRITLGIRHVRYHNETVSQYYYYCQKCLMRGPERQFIAVALEAWNSLPRDTFQPIDTLEVHEYDPSKVFLFKFADDTIQTGVVDRVTNDPDTGPCYHVIVYHSKTEEILRDDVIGWAPLPSGKVVENG